MGTVNMDGFRPATTAATAVKDRIGILTGRLFKRPETIDPTDPIHNLIRQIGGSAYMCIKHWKRVGDEPRIFIEVPESGFFGDRHPYQMGWVIASDGGCFGLTEDFRIVAGSSDVVCDDAVRGVCPRARSRAAPQTARSLAGRS